MKDSLTYQGAGVHPEKAADILSSFSKWQKGRKKDPNLLSGIGPYAAAYDLLPSLTAMKSPVLVTSCDGVGTKLKLAIDWNDLSGLGQDLVAMNVNDILCLGAQPSLFLDYFACGALKENQLGEILKSLQTACEDSGCSLAGGETAEMPGLYQGNDFDLAGFVIGFVDKDSIKGAKHVQKGDVILGLSASGFHSNGYSLVRKLVEKEKLNPESTPSFSNETWKQLLLKPTHLYNKKIEAVLPNINALAHITGGGLYENLPRILPDHLSAEISESKWQLPELYQWAQKTAQISTRQLLSTFNCGIGMLIVCTEENGKIIVDHFSKTDISIRPLGHITERKSEPVQWIEK